MLTKSVKSSWVNILLAEYEELHVNTRVCKLIFSVHLQEATSSPWRISERLLRSGLRTIAANAVEEKGCTTVTALNQSDKIPECIETDLGAGVLFL